MKTPGSTIPIPSQLEVPVLLPKLFSTVDRKRNAEIRVISVAEGSSVIPAYRQAGVFQ